MTTLNCEICGKRFRYEPVSLAGIMRDCGEDTTPYARAKWLTSKLGMLPKTLLCERCFWGEKMSKLRVWLFHLRLQWLGDEKFEKDGYGIIPCTECRTLFKSWVHYDSAWGFCYDGNCKFCESIKEMEDKNGKRTYGTKRRDKEFI